MACDVCGRPADAHWCAACVAWGDGTAVRLRSTPGMFAQLDANHATIMALKAAADPTCAECSAPGFVARGWNPGPDGAAIACACTLVPAGTTRLQREDQEGGTDG